MLPQIREPEDAQAVTDIILLADVRVQEVFSEERADADEPCGRGLCSNIEFTGKPSLSEVFANPCRAMIAMLDFASGIPDFPGLPRDVHFDAGPLHVLGPTRESNMVASGYDACGSIEFHPIRFEPHILVFQNAASGTSDYRF